MILKRITILLFLYVLICTGCEADYDIDGHFEGGFNPRVVLNSIISPDFEIEANLCWSKHYADTNDYKNVEVFDVELYEDGDLLKKQQYTNGYFYSNIYPKESKTYRLRIIVPNYGEINASTYIPAAVISTTELVKIVETDPDNTGFPYHFAHFKISKISSKEEVRAAWILTESFSPTSDEDSLSAIYRNFLIYSDNNFVDNLNARQDFWHSDAKGSNMSYNVFMRIPFDDFSKAIPLDFSIETTNRYEDRELDISNEESRPLPLYTIITTLSPSVDYDKYQESLYESLYINPFGSGSSSVYSNVENGLGIFAGYSHSLERIDIRQQPIIK